MELDLVKIRDTNAFRCLECGKCTGVCPVSRYSKTFSPRLLLIKSTRNSHPDAFKGADLWSCLTCRQCDSICPSNIKYIELIQLIRNFVGVENMEGTCSHGGILDSILKIMTTPDLKQQRLDWLSKEYQTSNSSEYLYFMGCLPYYDVLFSEIGVQPLNIARSTIKIFNYLDIKPKLLENEKCCGHDFFWNGDMENFKKLAELNIAQIKESGVKYVVTACAECYRTLKLDYQQIFGTLPFEIFHITEFLAQRLEEKNIKLKSSAGKMTFHDPCRLGRHMGIYDPPRQSLSRLSGTELIEMPHNRKRATCCGVSAWMNCSQVSKQIQGQRLREGNLTGADTFITACPKCQIHFQCALQDAQLKEEVKFTIKDFTEVIAESLN
ncbi:MAG: (Fe-S)-binding protein [Calditrichia bacterium]|nr:(Fe-S)-binding protein [Calditrichia bacterium]